MQVMKGTITSVSPLHFGNGRARGTFSQTLSYVPGRTIRGMIGWYLYQNTGIYLMHVVWQRIMNLKRCTSFSGMDILFQIKNALFMPLLRVVGAKNVAVLSRMMRMNALKW